MTEPKLEDIGDYNTLKGEKKRIVWAVIIAGLLIGLVYTVAYKVFDNPGDAIHVNDPITKIAVGQDVVPVE